MKHLSRLFPCILLCLLLATACTGGDGDKETQPLTDPAPAATETAVDPDPAVTDGETQAETPESAPTPETDETAVETDGQTESETQPQEEETMSTYEKMMNDLSTFPITFTYDGKDYRGFGDGFTVTDRTDTVEEDGTSSVLTIENPAINAVFELHGKQYPTYGAYDYYVVIRNDGESGTKVFENVLFDVRIDGGDATLKGINGDAGDQWYSPYEQKLNNQWVKKESTSGRPSHWVFPYFQLEHGRGGTMIAVGWSGRWKAHFKNDGTETTLIAGQYDLSTYLKPGETVRTPLMAFVDYEGDDNAATNAWRHWFIDCNMPTINDGEQLPTMLNSLSMADGANTTKIKLMISEFYRHDIDLDMFWLDAGWYTGIAGESVAWPQTGSLLMDTKDYPDRMAEITKLLGAHNAGLLLWFEPETVRLDSAAFVADNADFKAEWLLGRVFEGSWLEGDIIDFGNPEAVDWVFNRVCKVIDDAGGLAVYRQDFNCDPASAWDRHDGEGRTGMTENKYVCGYLAYWDRLLERYPGMFIDSCASGGGRNDLETLRRSVPLHYTDYFDGTITVETEGVKLGMTSELFKWFPYIKNWTAPSDNTMYQMRLNYTPAFGYKYGDGTEAMWSLFKAAADEYELIRDYYYADYYPLTESSKSLGTWTAWEFYDPARGEGFMQFFRTNGTPSESLTVQIQGLDPEATYTLTDTDGRINLTATGAELAESFTVTLPEDPGSAVILIKRV